MSEVRSREREARSPVPVPAAPQCLTCRFWHEFNSASPPPREHNSGQCRRYPPVIVYPFELHEVLPADYGFWPLTRPEDWCGEFEPTAGTD